MNDTEKLNALGSYLRAHCIGKSKQFKNREELAHALNKSRQTLSTAMNSDKIISKALADQLAEKVGNTMEFWLDLSSKKPQSHSDIDYENTTREELLIFWRHMGGRYLVDKDIIAAQRLKIIELTLFEKSCIQSASYDLRLGEIYSSNSNNSDDAYNLKKSLTYELKAGQSIVGKTLEYIQLPKYVLAHLGRLIDLVILGIDIQFGIQVDPTFSGRL